MNRLNLLPAVLSENRAEGLNFEGALRLLEAGLAVRRQDWEPGVYLYMELPLSSHAAQIILWNEATYERAPWQRSHTDLIADDWEEANLVKITG